MNLGTTTGPLRCHLSLAQHVAFFLFSEAFPILSRGDETTSWITIGRSDQLDSGCTGKMAGL